MKKSTKSKLNSPVTLWLMFKRYLWTGNFEVSLVVLVEHPLLFLGGEADAQHKAGEKQARKQFA